MSTWCLFPVILIGLAWIVAGLRVILKKTYTYYRNFGVGGMKRLDRQGPATNVFGLTIVAVGLVIFFSGVLGLNAEPNNAFAYLFPGGFIAGFIYVLGHYLGERIYRKQQINE